MRWSRKKGRAVGVKESKPQLQQTGRDDNLEKQLLYSGQKSSPPETVSSSTSTTSTESGKENEKVHPDRKLRIGNKDVFPIGRGKARPISNVASSKGMRRSRSQENPIALRSGNISGLRSKTKQFQGEKTIKPTQEKVHDLKTPPLLPRKIVEPIYQSGIKKRGMMGEESNITSWIAAGTTVATVGLSGMHTQEESMAGEAILQTDACESDTADLDGQPTAQSAPNPTQTGRDPSRVTSQSFSSMPMFTDDVDSENVDDVGKNESHDAAKDQVKTHGREGPNEALMNVSYSARPGSNKEEISDAVSDTNKTFYDRINQLLSSSSADTRRLAQYAVEQGCSYDQDFSPVVGHWVQQVQTKFSTFSVDKYDAGAEDSIPNMLMSDVSSLSLPKTLGGRGRSKYCHSTLANSRSRSRSCTSRSVISYSYCSQTGLTSSIRQGETETNDFNESASYTQFSVLEETGLVDPQEVVEVQFEFDPGIELPGEARQKRLQRRKAREENISIDDGDGYAGNGYGGDFVEEWENWAGECKMSKNKTVLEMMSDVVFCKHLPSGMTCHSGENESCLCK